MNKNILFTCYPIKNLEKFEVSTEEKQIIPGVILIFSCNRHKNTRLKKFRLSKKNYGEWKVFIIIGDPNLNDDYIINDNIITIKCEDSYIHLTKKVILAFKILFNLYTVTDGVLRCGDDLVFNETKLQTFLNSPNKQDYIGIPGRNEKNLVKIHDNFMPDYFINHPKDLLDPLNGIHYSLDEMLQFNEIPTSDYAIGVLVYFSKNACDILINHMEQINWNVFHKNENYGYPYIIEDVAIGYILNINNIYPLYDEIYCDSESNLLTDGPSIAYHTNHFK
jgi:hypothetical protein